ncbi:MAG: hypothetical protein ACAI44_37360 [Candidatus Sericytochromatia bacterium]
MSLTLMLGGSLLYGCGTPATRPISSQAAQSNRIMGDDPFVSQARLALASFQEVDASFNDSRRLASQRFSAKQLEGEAGAGVDGSVSGDGSVSANGAGVDTGVETSTDTSVSVDAGASSSDGGVTGSASGSASVSGSTQAGTGDSGGGTETGGGTDSGGTTGGSTGGTDSGGSTSGSASGGGSVSGSASGSAGGTGSTSVGVGGVNLNVGADTSLTANAQAGEDDNDIDLGIGSGLNGSLDTSLDNSAALSSNAQLAAQIDAMVNSNLGSLNRFDATVNLFNRAAAQFRPQLLASQGVELDATGKIILNGNRLTAQVKSELQGDAELANPSLDLNGELKANLHDNLKLQDLATLGFSASSSDVSVQAKADGSSSESVLLSFRNLDADVTNQVRVTTEVKGTETQELDLRLDTQSHGFVRNALREIKAAGNGREKVSTELSMELDNGTKINLTEQRFITLNGAGTGFGTFSITTGTGQSFSGTLRTMTSASGNLMMILEPGDEGAGRLMLQEKANGKANLILYNSQGSLEGSTELDLESTLDAMADA